MERHVELADQVLPLDLAGLHIVQLLLHAGGELYIHDVREPLAHQVVDHAAQRCQAQVLALLDDVLAVQNSGHGGRIGGGAANAVLLHGADKGGVGIAGRGLGEMLQGRKAHRRHLLALLQRRQGRVLLLLVVVPALLIYGGIAGEFQVAGGAPQGMGTGGDLHGDAVIHGVGHLAGQEAAPDQSVETVLLRRQVALHLLRRQRRVGGTDGLVGVLGSGLGLVLPGYSGAIGRAVAGLYQLAGLGLGLVGDTQRVGTHIGDQTHGALAGDVHALIQLLGDGHGPTGRHIQLAGGLLL